MPITGSPDTSSFITGPGGSDTQIQFNDGGVFGGDANFVWKKTPNVLQLAGATSEAATLAIYNNNGTSPLNYAIQITDDGTNTGNGYLFYVKTNEGWLTTNNARGQHFAVNAVSKMYLSNAGHLQIANSTASNATVTPMFNVVTDATTTIGQSIVLFASQTANAFQVLNSSSQKAFEITSAYKLGWTDGAGGATDTNLYRAVVTNPVLITDNRFEINVSNTNHITTNGANAHLFINNPSSVGQTSIHMEINGALGAKWRTDYQNNVNWVAGTGGSHVFYTGGDSGTGTPRFLLYTDGRANFGGNIDQNTIPTGQFEIFSNSATRIGLIVRGATSQTANIQEWQNSSSTILTRISSAGRLYLPDGTSALPSIAFGSDTDLDTGLYWPGQGKMAFVADSNLSAYFSITGLSIKTTEEQAALTVNGSVSIFHGSSYGFRTPNAVTNNGITSVSGTYTWYMKPLDNGATESIQWRKYNGTTITGRVQENGYWGFGATAPTAFVHISPTIAAAVQLDPYGTSAGNTAELMFMELAANGTNYTSFKAADSLAQSTAYKLPSTDPTAGQLLSSSAPSAGICTLSWTTPTASGITTGTSVITSGTDTRVLFNDGGVVGEDGGLVYNKTTDTLTTKIIQFTDSAASSPNVEFRNTSYSSTLVGPTIYPSSGTNIGNIIAVAPRGTGTASIKSEIIVFGTDYVASPGAYEFCGLRATGTSYVFAGGTLGQSLRPFILAANIDATNNLLYMNTDDTVSIRSAGVVGSCYFYVGGVAGVKAGGSTTVSAKVGGTLFDHFADVGNIGAGEDDLYSDTIAASALGANGDKLEAYYAVLAVSGVGTRRVRVYFGGTVIYDSGANIYASNQDMDIRVNIIRESSTVVRATVMAATTNSPAAPYAQYTRITGLTLSNTQVLKITGESGDATNDDIIAKHSSMKWLPAA